MTTSNQYTNTVGAAAISIDPITNDNILNAIEASQDITVTGQVTGDYEAILSIIVKVDGQIFSATVSEDGSYSVEVPGSVLSNATEIGVHAKVGDAYENVAMVCSKLDYSVDVEPPTVTVTINPITADNTINQEEATQQVTITGQVAGDFVAGDTVTLTVGSETFDTTVDANGNYSVDVPGSLLADNTAVNAEITVVDAANNSATGIAVQPYEVEIDPCEDPGIDGDAQFLNHLGANLTDSQGPSDEHGKTGGKYGTDINYSTSELNDFIYIGYYEFDVAGHLVESCGDGDFERDHGDGNVLWNLETYAGNDLVHIREDQNAYTTAKLGTGNDTIYVQGEMDSVLGLAQTNLEARSFIYTEECHDTVVIGGNGEGKVTGWGIDGGRIFTGSGNDNVAVYGEMDDGGVIDLGAGRTEFALDKNASATVDSSENVNYLSITHNLGNAGHYDFGHVFGGDANDHVTIGTFVEGTSQINLGKGDNTVHIGDDLDGQAKIITGSGDDIVYIGDDTEDYSSIDLCGGNNEITIDSTVEDHSTIKTGNGDDLLTVGYAIVNYADINLGGGNNTITVGDDVDGYSGLRTGNGDDVLHIGDDTEDGAVIDLGHGDNLITIASNVEDRSSICVGNGNDIINVATSMLNHSEIRLGEGDNTLTFGKNIHGSVNVSSGAGDDVLEVGHKIDGHAKINLGEGTNTITTGDDVDGRTILTTGHGNDSLTIGDDVEDYAQINLGNGDNTIEVADALEDRSSILTGNGNDTLNVGGSMWNSASVELGAGNDVMTINGSLYHHSKIDLGSGNDFITVEGPKLKGDIVGGRGQDTLILDYTEDSSLVDHHLRITNATTENITGIEVVKLSGQNVLDIRFTDLFEDASRDGALFVKGDSDSKVDLGSTNWNSDGAEKAQWQDKTGGTWSMTDTSIVDGIDYNVYHNSHAFDTTNDVYIEQGVVVI